MTNAEKLKSLITDLIKNNKHQFYNIGGDLIRETPNGIEVLFNTGDTDVVISLSNQILR